MAPHSMFRDLVAYLSAPSVRIDYAIEALKEYILYRRSKGDTLFEVSIGLAELEEQVSYPSTRTYLFGRPQYTDHRLHHILQSLSIEQKKQPISLALAISLLPLACFHCIDHNRQSLS